MPSSQFKTKLKYPYFQMRRWRGVCLLQRLQYLQYFPPGRHGCRVFQITANELWQEYPNYIGRLSWSLKKFTYCCAFKSFLCTKQFFGLRLFYSRSFQKYSRTSGENSRTFQGYPTNFQFQGLFKDFSRPVPCELYKIHGLNFKFII